MKKKMICIECPVGCLLEVDVEADGEVSVSGNRCEKGATYARKEMTCPERFLTSTVKAEGLEMKMVPVRTDRPVPKDKMAEVMTIVHQEIIKSPVKAGDVIVRNVLGLEANLIATRSAAESLEIGPKGAGHQ